MAGGGTLHPNNHACSFIYAVRRSTLLSSGNKDGINMPTPAGALHHAHVDEYYIGFTNPVMLGGGGKERPHDLPVNNCEIQDTRPIDGLLSGILIRHIT